MSTLWLLLGAALGAQLEVSWPDQQAVVDTSADTLTLADGRVFEAVRNGAPVWDWARNPNQYWVLEILPHDVPDDWDGLMRDWVFMPEGTVEAEWAATGGCWGGPDPPEYLASQRHGIGGYIQYCQTRVLELSGGVGVVFGYPASWVEVLPVFPGRVPGDVSLDGRFNSDDFVRVFQMGLYETGDPATWRSGDWDGDGLASSSDFVVAFQAGAYELPPAAVLVPEPVAIWLLLVGLLAASGCQK